MRRILVAVTAALCVLPALSACSSDSGPASVLRAFAEGVPQTKLDGVGFIDSLGNPITSLAVTSQIKELAGELPIGQIKLTPVGDPDVNDSDATGKVDVDWTIKGVTWHYQTTVRLRGAEDTWRVVWSPQTLNPELKAGDKLAARTIPAARGQIVDAAGQAIVKPRPVVVVGIEPRRVVNQAALLSALAAAFKSARVSVSLDDLPAQLRTAKRDAFVEVVTLRREVYDQISGQIHDLDGTVFREEQLQLAPSRVFARALLGSVGDVRKDQMDANPGKYAIGDQVGQGGLQEQYDDVLRGTGGVRVVITGRGDKDVELYKADAKGGQPLKTTLDERVQNAADAALAKQKNRAALVAIRVSDGAILAVANGPDGGAVNLAFTASVPPGSTFKMVSALGLLDKGAVTLDKVVNCPKEYTVSGRTFKNDHDFVLGAVPFRVDFAKSCNTAFASLAGELGGDGLRNAAASLGIGTPWNLGTAVNTGSVQTNASPVDAAAAAFGQGQTQVSPLAMAGATAAVARGSWQQPKLFTALPAGAPAASPAPAPVTPNGTALKATSVEALRTMMREVVTGGTATALGDVPGGQVQVKTGTAEYDNNPDHTHAWTVGWQGDIAFAVFVENGGSSSATAIPIVESFLRNLR